MNPFPAGSYLIFAFFVVSILATIAGALIAVLATRIVRGVGGLAICCVGLAGLYYFLHSPFLALMEILIYIGAVCVTIIFAVMLAEPDETPSREKPRAALLWTACALVISGVVFLGIAHLGLNHPWTSPGPRLNQGSVKDIGVALLSTYSLPFEVISLVLVAAILGALVIARQGRSSH